MEREAFRQRMQQYKQARENNPQLKYWDWKKENDLGYQLYKNNLPSNLQVETDDYDLYGAYESNMQPELNEDGTYHLGSRDPYTGRILKSKQHPTYQKAIESEISAGYFPYEKNNVTYTKTYSPVDISGYADGGEVKDNTYVAPVHKEQVFIPATGAQKIKNDYQYKYGSKSPYKGGELEIVSPEFDILTGVRGLKSTINNLLDNYIGRKLPSNYAYRRTVQQELDDIITTNSFREIPENVVTTGGRTITLPNGKTVTLKKAKGNSHGGKAFSAGDVWKGTTSSGNNSSEIIVGVPGGNAKWMVGKHGNYQGPYNFSDIEKGSGLFVPFDAEGIANISTEGLKYFKPSKYFNNRYIKYADGGTIDEVPPQNTSERPITNFDPKGDPYNPTYGYNPGAGYVKSVFDLYDAPVIGDALSIYGATQALKNKDWLGAGLAALTVVPFIPTVSSYKKSLNQQLNRITGITPDVSKLQKQSDWNDLRNRSIERLYDPEVRARAAKIKSDYNVDLQSTYDKIINQYENDYFSLPETEIVQLQDAKAMLDLQEEAARRYRQYGIKPTQKDFRIKVDNAVTPNQEITNHEINHFNQYIHQDNLSWNKSELNKITKQFEGKLRDKNPIDPENTNYFMNWMEQNAYDINMLDRLKELNIKPTKQNILKYLKSLPDTDSIKKAALQFKNLDDYIKWLNTMPLADNGNINEIENYNFA